MILPKYGQLSGADGVISSFLFDSFSRALVSYLEPLTSVQALVSLVSAHYGQLCGADDPLLRVFLATHDKKMVSYLEPVMNFGVFGQCQLIDRLKLVG